MNTCGTCKHFGSEVRDDDNGHLIPTGYHVCRWVEHISTMNGEEATESAVVIDGSGFYAALCVKEDFGCNQWKPQE